MTNLTRTARIGVLLTNLGTPDHPTGWAIRRYLKEFLSDKRVVDLPRWFWLPLLNGLILNVRPPKIAKKYQKIWTSKGSPLLAIAQEQADRLEEKMRKDHPNVRVALGMRYGNPSLSKAYQALKKQGITHLLVLPLYPHYSAATTGSTFDGIAAVLRQERVVPSLHFIDHYAQSPLYIDAMASSIKAHWNTQGQGGHLLFSYHGLPQRFVDAGDPYYQQCIDSTNKIVAQLGLASDKWSIAFQSQFGFDKWLQPNTEKECLRLASEGKTKLEVICPGFSADCLETLEEINLELRATFLEAGGQQFNYIPALNTQEKHLQCLEALIVNALKSWDII